ncbi:hypothetical protein V491_02234 [Pseudogymnoascus sp. VKM F-3775]|nr:hypothetical protein V491_02234 [Pseudogymnoascus sp. VKM F-3775]
MASGVKGFVNKKHQQYGGNENDAPAVQPELAQRQATVRDMGLKLPGPAAGRRSLSASGVGVPFRDAATGPVRVGSPLTIQRAGSQNGFAAQGRNYSNGQGQTYAYRDPLWAESTLGSDSLDTVKDRSFGPYDDENDHELGDTQGQHFEGHDQDVGLSPDQRSDSDPEEEEADQNNGKYHHYNPNLRQPGTNQSNIPMRGVATGRFIHERQIQQRQSAVMETVLPNVKMAVNGSGQNYSQKQIPGRRGHQVQEDGDQQQGVDRFAPSEVDENTMHSIASNGRSHLQKASSKRQADDISAIDFDQETLYKMPYQKLRNQPFDEDPNQPKTPVTPPLTGHPKTIDERMEMFKSQPPGDRAEFLAALSIDEWEEAGEWLMKQFGIVMNKVAGARRKRRKIASEFEDKLAARDAEVRERTDGVTAALKDLKNGGQDLLRGKTPI